MDVVVLTNASVLDGTGADPQDGMEIHVERGLITKVAKAGAGPHPSGARVIDLEGRTAMPGLTDAHVHMAWLGAPGMDIPSDDPAGPTLVTYVLRVIENIEIALSEGFTTLRDAGGMDAAFVRAIGAGLIAGPRILPSGSFISQTGGHGDLRSLYDDAVPQAIPGLFAAPCISDGVDAMRASARTQLRRGATQVKLMASGGVMSPTDPLDSLQFTVEEMAAAVGEAEAAGTYVMAHCHTSPSVERALDAGIVSIEHASLLREETARRMAEQGAFMVPTLLTSERSYRRASELGLSEDTLVKLDRIRTPAHVSVGVAARAGVRVGSGSDLIGSAQRGRAEELELKAAQIGPMGAIVAATRVNAELFGLQDRIGTIEVGKEADIIAVTRNPIDDIASLADAGNIPLVIKGGAIAKNELEASR
jgi:imidazolonepropionase-like amidohydrolase